MMTQAPQVFSVEITDVVEGWAVELGEVGNPNKIILFTDKFKPVVKQHFELTLRRIKKDWYRNYELLLPFTYRVEFYPLKSIIFIPKPGNII